MSNASIANYPQTPIREQNDSSSTNLQTLSWDSFPRSIRPVSPALNPLPALMQMFMASYQEVVSGKGEIKKMSITDFFKSRYRSAETHGLLGEQPTGTCLSLHFGWWKELQTVPASGKYGEGGLQ